MPSSETHFTEFWRRLDRALWQEHEDPATAAEASSCQGLSVEDACKKILRHRLTAQGIRVPAERSFAV